MRHPHVPDLVEAFQSGLDIVGFDGLCVGVIQRKERFFRVLVHGQDWVTEIPTGIKNPSLQTAHNIAIEFALTYQKEPPKRRRSRRQQ